MYIHEINEIICLNTHGMQDHLTNFGSCHIWINGLAFKFQTTACVQPEKLQVVFIVQFAQKQKLPHLLLNNYNYLMYIFSMLRYHFCEKFQLFLKTYITNL